MRTQTATRPSHPQIAESVLAPESLGYYAYEAIHKHFKKSIKHKAGVLKDQDPEPLHQMRVGMRRLRTALQVFETAVQVPEGASREHIGKLAKRLGKVRDLDVLQMWFQKYLETTAIPPQESQHIQRVLKHLQRKRRSQFAHAKKMLKGKSYHQFEAAFTNWLQHPSYHIQARMPIVAVIPDLLLPLISQLLLHPGWLVAIEMESNQFRPISHITLEALDQSLDQHGADLHDLRKQIKRVRYQTEFFLGFYSRAYQKQTEEFQTLQDILGQLQDSVVLSQFLAQGLGKNWPQAVPSLKAYFQQERLQLWQQLQTLQKKYLDPDYRKLLRRRVLTPKSEVG